MFIAPFDPIVSAPFGTAAFVGVNIRGVPLFQTEPEGFRRRCYKPATPIGVKPWEA
jgi:hypothetical protein